MKLGAYLKEKWAVILGTVLLVASIWLMGYAFKVSNAYMEALTVLLAFFVLYILIGEYTKKRKFYKEFQSILEMMDQKYLITDMALNPDFQEAKIMMDALYEIDRSMKDKLNDMENTVMDFKEYLELWIHEIKIPISALSLMNYNGSTDAGRQRTQIDRVSFMVEQILFYARADAAEKDYLLNGCNLSTMVNKAVMQQKDLLIGNKIGIEKENLDLSVVTDSKWMEFILGQIINNSIKYMDEENKETHYIKFYAEETETETVLVAEDNGIGISEKDVPYVFDKIFTGENGRKGKISTGMGLYICKRLCDKLGHKIAVESVEGEYTRVKIVFGKNTFYEM